MSGVDDLKAAGQALAQAGATLYLDISPLLELHWTGIPIVTAGLAQALLTHLPQHSAFFVDLSLVQPGVVADAVARASGFWLQRAFETGDGMGGPLPVLAPSAAPSLGLFPTVKRVRRVFTREASLVHDISTLLLPQFHQAKNIRHHMETLRDDLASNDVTVAVSTATRDDLVAYLGLDPAGILVAPNGVSWPASFAPNAANRLARGAEPYVLILGTREPRKNVLKLFEMLAAHPALLQSHRFVVAGRMGWLAELQALPPGLNAAVQAGRIMFPGYVSEAQKYTLLAGAAASLYPSLFEGFGLPVLESLSLGTPCVASWSSAIPEVGGDLCDYFDPFDAQDMYRALQATLARAAAEGEALRSACRSRAAQFSWPRMAAAILHRLTRSLAT